VGEQGGGGVLKGVDGGYGREEPGAWRLLGGENMRLRL
jgi:hypothetical protein